MKKFSTIFGILVLLGAANPPIYAQTANEWFDKGFNSDNNTLKVKYFTKAIENRYSPIAHAYCNRGRAKLDLGQHESAILDFDKAIELKPDDAIAYNNRGNAKRKLGQHPLAILDYNKAIELNYEFAYYNRGNAKGESRQYQSAIRDFDKFIELKPNYADAYNNRGLAKYYLGQYPSAILDYDKAIELKPNDPEAYNNRGRAKSELKQYQAAISDYDKAIELNLDYPAVYNNRGQAHYLMGNYDQAIADYDQSIVLGGSSFNPFYKYREDAVAKRNALLDKTPPTITITEPILDARGLGISELFEVQTQLRGSVTDANGIQTFQINRKTIPLERDGRFTATVKLAEGDNMFVLRATDTKGNVAEKTITLHRSLPPVVEPVQPKPVVVTTEKRLALLIGNSQYQQVISLTNPANDVQAMEQKLKNLGFEVITAVNLNRTQMQEKIRTFSRLLKDFDVGLFFYAGHGVEVGGINYLLPTDMPKPKDIIKADMPEKAIQTNYVESAMRDGGNENKTYILILDACRNDPFRMWRDIPDESPTWTPPKTVPSGFLTIYAASQGERAGDGTGSNGTFTAALLQHLATPCISVQSMLIRVRTELKKYQGIQEPEERSKLNKEFCFKPCKH